MNYQYKRYGCFMDEAALDLTTGIEIVSQKKTESPEACEEYAMTLPDVTGFYWNKKDKEGVTLKFNNYYFKVMNPIYLNHFFFRSLRYLRNFIYLE